MESRDSIPILMTELCKFSRDIIYDSISSETLDQLMEEGVDESDSMPSDLSEQLHAFINLNLLTDVQLELEAMLSYPLITDSPEVIALSDALNTLFINKLCYKTRIIHSIIV